MKFFQFKDEQKKVIQGRKEAFHWKSTHEAHDNMALEMLDLRLTKAAYEGKRSSAAGVAEGSLSSRTRGSG